jgi:SNF2 family DNA or RNA helicase
LIKDAIEVPHVVHYGTGQTAQEAQQAQDRFKADPDITCFLTSDAGKEGLNMQCARTVIQLDPTYSYDDTYQRASRIHRADSHLDGLTNVVYVTEGSVEERVWKTNLAGRLINESIQGSVESLNFGSSLTWADRERAQRSEAENLAWMIFGRD